MEIIGNKFRTGDRVECNGNKNGTVIRYYSTAMVEVRLMDGCRNVGVVCVDERELKRIS